MFMVYFLYLMKEHQPGGMRASQGTFSSIHKPLLFHIIMHDEAGSLLYHCKQETIDQILHIQFLCSSNIDITVIILGFWI